MSSFLLISCRKQVGPALSNFSKKEDYAAWGLRSNSPGEPWQGFRESVLSEGEWGEQDGHRAEQGYGLRWGLASSQPHGEPSSTNGIPELGPVMAASKRGWRGVASLIKGVLFGWGQSSEKTNNTHSGWEIASSLVKNIGQDTNSIHFCMPGESPNSIEEMLWPKWISKKNQSLSIKWPTLLCLGNVIACITLMSAAFG